MDNKELIIYSTFVLYVSMIVFLILIIWRIVKIIYRIIIRNWFKKEYSIDKIPNSVQIEKTKRVDHNYFILKYPYWKFSKKDGTKDKRMKNNFIIWRVSCLYIGSFKVTSKKTYDLLYVVTQLRTQNVKINLCKEEKNKYNKLLRKKELYTQNNNIQKIIAYYEECPTEFEKFCAELFNKMGYAAKVTAQTNDGGYDIIVSKMNKVAIVECKCYSLNNKIGRPAIQKLVGANNIVGAERMIFITTSKFSLPAISYAKEVGVELVDGEKLLQLLDKYNHINQQKVYVSLNEWQLKISDMKPFVPIDIYKKYFLYYKKKI